MLSPDVQARVGSRAQDHAESVRTMFDRIAPTYDRLNRWLSLGIDVRWRKTAIAELLDSLPEGPIADICSGTLDLTEMLKRQAPTRPVMALDFSLPMLSAGRHKVRGQVQIAVADAMRLPLGDNSVAGVICGFGVRNIADPKRAMIECLRTLKPGGNMVILEFFQPTRPVTRAFHSMYGRILLPKVGGWVSKDRSAYAYLSESMQKFFTREAFAEMLSSIGFESVKGFDLTLGVASVIVAKKSV